MNLDLGAQQAKRMLDQLREDFYNTTGNLGHINLPEYQTKFNVSDDDIIEYCNSLEMIVPIHPVCFICQGEWMGLEKRIRPINNGHILDWYHSFSLWCCGPEGNYHDLIAYNQTREGVCSFELEVEDLHSFDFLIRWNCDCGDMDCYKQNTIIWRKPQKYYDDYITVNKGHNLAYNPDRESIWNLVKNKLIFI